jgi:NO-binding membrane sensor protein with MHYT domain
MKAYVISTGATFALLAVMHLWRVTVEPHLARDPWFLIATAASGGLAVWAWHVVRRAARS